MSPPALLPMLWICGAPAAGKSVTAWSLFERLRDEGITVAYVDVDQLGMLYPETDDDPDRYALKTAALNALIPNYAAAGAELLVVSGVLDPASPTDLASHYPHADVTFCLLNPDPEVLRTRILERGWDDEDADEVIAEAAALAEVAFAHTEIDTTTLSVTEVVHRLRHLAQRLEDRRPQRDALPAGRSQGTAALLVLTGPRAVGTSTVGFGLARAAWEQGISTGFVDLDQLAFLRGPAVTSQGNAGLGLANTAALHELFASRGAASLIVSSHLADRTEHQHLRSAAAHARVTVVRLRGDETTLAAHVRERTAGSTARLAGDDLTNADPTYQEQVLREATTRQRDLDQQALEDALIDVSSRTADSVVEEVTKRTRHHQSA